jgi:hypothetical protein
LRGTKEQNSNGVAAFSNCTRVPSPSLFYIARADCLFYLTLSLELAQLPNIYEILLQARLHGKRSFHLTQLNHLKMSTNAS